MRTSTTALLIAWTAAAASAQTKTTKAPAEPVEPRPWEHESSDLAPDPAIQFGALDNGFRYAWVNHGEPKNAIFLRLHVNVGSLVETETELGMAHFVEHMAFNGTTNFKAGTLVESFNKQGIKFGSDVNAHTGIEETVYELDLPDAEPKRLQESMTWFRDIACGLKMAESEVKAEKGVIDSEQRDRDSKGFRLFVEQLEKALDGTLFPKRLPIGVQAVRAKFSSKSCLAFYRKWYRPEHMTFVMVGDLGELDPSELIEKTFGTIKVPKEPLPARPDLGQLSFKHKGFSIVTPDATGGSITIARVRPAEDRPDDSKTRAAGVPLQIAYSAATDRIRKRVQEDKLPLGSAGFGSFDLETTLAEGAALQVHCEAAKWREALMAAERELRRILEEGFTAEEVRAAYIEYDRGLVQRPRFPPPHARMYVEEILHACNVRYVPMEDRAGKDAYRPGARASTVEAVTAAFRDAWTRGQLVIYTQGGIDPGADPEAELMAAWKAAQATGLDEPMPAATATTGEAEATAATDPEADPGTTPKPEPDPAAAKADAKDFAYATPNAVRDPTAKVERDDELRIADLQLENGVRAYYKKPEPGERDLGRFEVRVGEGESALAPDQHAVAWMAEQFFLAGGLAKNDWATVQAAGGAVGFEVAADALVFSGILFGGEPKRQFESICAYLTDPGFRQDAWDEFRKELPKRFEKKPETKPDEKPGLGALMEQFNEQLHAAEPRLRTPDLASLEAVTLEQVKQFLTAQLDGPVRITVTGMLPEKVERSIFSTFSKLPKRRAARDTSANRKIAPLAAGVSQKHSIDTGEKSALIHVAYAAPDAADLASALRLDLLEDIVQDRLRVEIREKRGGAYSPSGSVWGSDAWKGLGWVTLDVQVDPDKVDAMTKACTATMETLGSKGVTQQDLDRIRTARMGDAEARRTDANLWFWALGVAHREPAIIDAMRDYKSLYDRVTVAEINALCKQIFAKGRANVFVAVPPG